MTTAVVVWTMGDEAGVSPQGRSPMSFGSASIFPSRVERTPFSSSTACLTSARNASFTFFSSAQDSDRMSTSMLTSAGIELTEVPPRTTPMLNVVLGSTGTCSRENFAMALPIANAGLTSPNAP